MVLTRYHRDEFPAVRAAIEATPAPVRESFRAAYTGVAADVLPWMREQDAADLADFHAALDAVRPVSPTAIRDIHDRGTWLPVSIGLASVPLTVPEPLPTRDLTERCAAVSTAIHADYERHLDTLHVLGEISAVLAEHPEALAPPSHPGIRLGLRRAHAELVAMLKAGA